MNKKVELEGYQRAFLRKSAHTLKPVVSIGHAGASPAIEKSVEEALACHELIKIKFQDLKDERFDICDHLAEEHQAHVISVIGNVGILYRPAAKSEDRIYTLPDRAKKPSSARPARRTSK